MVLLVCRCGISLC
jgi:hypothetical protein